MVPVPFFFIFINYNCEKIEFSHRLVLKDFRHIYLVVEGCTEVMF